VGLRLAADVLMEVSYHVVEPVLLTTLTSNVTAGSGATVSIASMGTPTNALYVGALVVLGWQASDVEIVTVISVGTNSFTANVANNHTSGETVLSPTFPLQQATDPIFTQAEMLGYLARAQNEFLSQCPVVYAMATGQTTYGQYLQSAPTNMIEMERVSLSQMSLTGVSLSRNGTGTVTATFGYPHGLVQNQTFTIYQSVDTSFLGAFAVATVTSPTVVTWLQDGTAGTSASASLGLFKRLYEQTQEENTMFDRTWRNDFTPVPTGWFEDRSGNYGWGLNSAPGGNFPMNLIYSTRGPGVLNLLSSFVVPDICVYIMKNLVLSYAWGKDGVFSSPLRSQWCKQRFDRGVAIVSRFFEGNELALTKRR